MWSVIQLRAYTSTPGIENYYCQALVQVKAPASQQTPTLNKVPQKGEKGSINQSLSHLTTSHGPVVVQELYHGEGHGDQAEEDVRQGHADYQHIARVPGYTVPENIGPIK